MSRNRPIPLKREPRIADLIGFNLQMAALRVVGQTRDCLADAGISLAKVTALSFVRTNPGCDQSALGRALQINRAGAMKLMHSLAARGLVERRNGRDLRAKALYLTPAGEDLLEQCLPLIEQADAEIASLFEPAELAALRIALERLGQRMQHPSDPIPEDSLIR